MEEMFNYYRIKTEWLAEKEDGGLMKVKTEELVFASSYTEAEKVAYELTENQSRTQFGSVNIEIVKTKITELLHNDNLVQDNKMVAGLICNYFEETENTGVGIYAVKVMYITLDEKTGKEKRNSETIYTPASSNTAAATYVQNYLKRFETRDFIIRDTKFDNAEAILWPAHIHQQKLNQMIS
jgi:hypothetical protein